MKVLIKNGLVIDPKNGINEKNDILLEDRYVSKISKKIDEEVDTILDAKNMIVSPGFVDLHTNFCDPGVTSREDLKTGSFSAAKGGYTHIVLGVDNKPAPSECNVIEYIKKYANIMPINLYPSATVTIDRQGSEIVDFEFLHNHGAIAFYDGLKPIEDKMLLEKIMTNIKKVKAVLSIYSERIDRVKVRGVLDGQVAKSLGIKQGTKIDDEVADLKENLTIAKILGTTLDLAYISAKESVELVEQYKNDGMEMFVEIQALNLMLTDKALAKNTGNVKYDTNAKVLPPLRSDVDRKALIKGLKDGVIDIISSNHVPVTQIDKEDKLKNAIAGAIGLETTLGILGLKLVEQEKFDWQDIIKYISLNPAKVYGLDELGAGGIDEGKLANITIFDPDEKWKLVEDSIVSKSHNTPLIGVGLKSKVKWTISNGRLVYKDVADVPVKQVEPEVKENKDEQDSE